MSKRGYCSIGVYHIKHIENIGTLWRSAAYFGADFIFTIGKRYKGQPSDTLNTSKHLPLFHYLDFDDFYNHMPYNCILTAIEIADVSTDARDFIHPQQAIYLLGAEDYGLPEKVLSRCGYVIEVPRPIEVSCLNVATIGSIILWDRYVKGNVPFRKGN